MQLQIDISDIKNHKEAAKKLLLFCGNYKILLFDAPMGAGKTTFIKTLCSELGVTDAMSSPTYSIVNEYQTKTDLKIYHFDLYRLQSSEELFNIGFEEYIDSDNYCFIEWPELAMPFLNTWVTITIELKGNNRYLCAEKINP